MPKKIKDRENYSLRNKNSQIFNVNKPPTGRSRGLNKLGRIGGFYRFYICNLLIKF